MNHGRQTGLRAKFLDALATGPVSMNMLVASVGTTRQRIARLAHRYSDLVERVDETPLAGPHSRPMYALRKYPKRKAT